MNEKSAIWYYSVKGSDYGYMPEYFERAIGAPWAKRKIAELTGIDKDELTVWIDRWPH